MISPMPDDRPPPKTPTRHPPSGRKATMTAKPLVTARPAAAARAPSPAWSPCPHCWGQRRIWTPEEARNGEGAILVATTCPECLGLGDVLR